MQAVRHFHTLFTITLLLAVCFEGMSMLVPRTALGQQTVEGPIDFDIPSESLSLALAAYTRVTGQGVFVDGGLVSGRQSTVVRGMLTTGDALRTLLIGTGLAVRYGDGNIFTLVPEQEAGGNNFQSPSENPPLDLDNDGADYRYYFADIQSALKVALCAHPETKPGGYSIGMELWIGSTGAVTEFSLLTSSGDSSRDAALLKTLRAINIAEPPPADMPEPVTIAIVMNRTTADCSGNPNAP